MNDAATERTTVGTVTPGGTVTVEPFHHLNRYWQDTGHTLKWDCLFMLPPWIGAWQRYFGQGPETRLCIVKQNGALLGIAPLTVTGDSASLVSDSDLIDYSDFVVAPSKEGAFISVLFEYLRREGIHRFQMPRVRADFSVSSCLGEFSASPACDISCSAVGELYEMELPDTWDGYLHLLSGTERHETRRKLRRLEASGRLELRIITGREDIPDAMDTFITLFRSNRPEKAQFMTGAVESFFRSLAAGMSEAGLLKLFFLDLDGTPVAATMCFDYLDAVYLYNNGYDRRFNHLSVGLLSKVFSIRESIRNGRKRYNFLRGGETYKGRLGGRPTGLLRCEVILK